ncbi:MAG: tRNA (adenosine(37)-N6)-threonylcarbamoyltransferase complex dimerization subunit type 1 TsaB [Gemmatimonadaceae bacterium]|jgi:tRNA threonylcarbamoyladenosine biosynthesis protein TsaB
MDRLTLALDGSTYEGSVALIRGSAVIAEVTLKDEGGSPSRGGRGERLLPAIAGCLDEAGVKGGDITAIVCGSGPGSFTSLRVAGSIAKGLASGYGVDLYAVSSLLLTVTGAQPPLPSGEYLSVLDAMRGEFYAARILLPAEAGSAVIQTEAPSIISAQQLTDVQVTERALKVIGPGQEIHAKPQARGVALIVEQILNRSPVDLAAWEPDYGRLAEAQVRWEATHGRKLTT